MKKYLISFLIILLLTLSSCSETKQKKLIVTTIFPQYDIVRAITNDLVDIHLIIKPGVDTHSYDPSVDDIVKIKKSDLFIYTSRSLESWATNLKEENILELASNNKILLHEVEEKHEHHTVHHEHNVDPHIWTSPTYVKYMVEDIYNELIKIDPDNLEIYKTNKNKYISELNKIITRGNDLKNIAKDHLFYFGTPFSMLYFFLEFDLHFESIYETCSTEIEPSINDIINMHETIKTNNVLHLYVKELVSISIALRIVENTNCEIKLLHSGHNLTKEEFNSGKTLIDIFNDNITLLESEVTRETN